MTLPDRDKVWSANTFICNTAHEIVSFLINRAPCIVVETAARIPAINHLREDVLMRLITLLAGACIAFLAAPAVAQNTQEGTPTHVRGTVEKFDGQMLVVKSREGQDVRIMLAKDFKVNAVSRANLSDIKRGDFIGSAAMQAPTVGSMLRRC
jgi:hypothetical protein